MLTLPTARVQRLRCIVPAVRCLAISSSLRSSAASPCLHPQFLQPHRLPAIRLLSAQARPALPRPGLRHRPLRAAAAVLALTAVATVASAVCESSPEEEAAREAEEQRLAALVVAVVRSLQAPDPSLSQAEWEYLQVFACQSPCTAYRYLMASGERVDRAVAAVKATVRWRLAEGVDGLTAAALRDKVEEHSIWVSSGRDTRGGPVIIARKSGQSETDHRRQFQLIVYTLERAVRQMDDDAQRWPQPTSSTASASSPSLSSACTGRWTLLLAMSQFSRSSSTPMSEMQRVVDTLRLHYVERLRVAVVLDAPTYFVFVVRCVSLLLPASLKRKVVFLSDLDKPETQRQLQQYIALDQLEQPWGSLQPRSVDEYIAEDEYSLKHSQSSRQLQRREHEAGGMY